MRYRIHPEFGGHYPIGIKGGLDSVPSLSCSAIEGGKPLIDALRGVGEISEAQRWKACEIGEGDVRTKRQSLERGPVKGIESAPDCGPNDLGLLPKKEGPEQVATLCCVQRPPDPPSRMAALHCQPHPHGNQMFGLRRQCRSPGEMVNEPGFNADPAIDLAKRLGERLELRTTFLAIAAAGRQRRPPHRNADPS